jgi:hypothetical protein
MGNAIEITRSDRSARALRKLAESTEDGDLVRRLLGIALDSHPLLSPNSRRSCAKILACDAADR